jgi:hypothetical protein
MTQNEAMGDTLLSRFLRFGQMANITCSTPQAFSVMRTSVTSMNWWCSSRNIRTGTAGSS